MKKWDKNSPAAKDDIFHKARLLACFQREAAAIGCPPLLLTH